MILAREFEFEVFQADEFIADGNTVIVLGHQRCRVRGTGRIVEVEWVQALTLRDGSVCRHREYSDTAAWESAFASR